jgi:hypothetical protein
MQLLPVWQIIFKPKNKIDMKLPDIIESNKRAISMLTDPRR